MNNENISAFSGKADTYAKGRPGYPKTALDFIASVGVSNGCKIADMGSGTGIFSKHLLNLGAEVYGVEINTDMRQKAEKELAYLAKFHSIAAGAEQTGLPDNSVDFVSAAQSFHWFDKALFKQECNRILTPGGKIILVWNTEVFGNAFFNEYGKVLKKFTSDTNKNTKEASFEDFFFKPAEAFLAHFDRREFDNTLSLDKETFILKSLSSSAAPARDNPKYAPFVSALEDVFDRFQEKEKLAYPHKTVVFIGSL